MKINISIYILQYELKFSTVTPPLGLKSRVRHCDPVKYEFFNVLQYIYQLRILCEQYNVCRKMIILYGCSDNFLLKGWQPGS